MATSDAEEVEWLTEEEVSPFIREAETFGADSSDDEDKQVSTSEPPPKKPRMSFDHQNTTIENELENLKTHENILSFITLAIGIKLLYSRRVEEAYKAKKRHSLQNFRVPGVEALNKGIRLAAEHVHLYQKNLDLQAITANILKTIRADFKGFFKSLHSRESMGEFFKVLISEEGGFGYFKYNLLSTRYEELGTLRMTLNEEIVKKYFAEEIIVDSSRNFWVNFLSSLRLHNRMAKRVAKYDYKGKGVNKKKWAILNGYFKTRVTLDVMGSNGRHDVVNGLGSYPEFKEILTKEELDRFPLVRCAKGYMLSDNAVKLHFLLFGVEVMRSPSAFIHHMMFLDLVKAGKCSWEEAFRDRKLPMSIIGAVEASRQKHRMYNELMKHKYTYDHKTWGSRNDINTELHLTLEKKITQDWLNMKLEEDEQPGISSEAQDVATICKLIKEACIEWCGIDIDLEKRVSCDTPSISSYFKERKSYATSGTHG